jgi:hypothetical protein
MDMISRKSMRLTTKARRIYPDGKINAMLAADASVAVRPLLTYYRLRLDNI